MLTEKANAICLLEVLKEYSDAEHILPMREIIAKMQSLYGIKIDRRTVYGAVALLIELGYDVSIYEDNGVGYYLRSRELEQSEVLLLTDAVYSFPFIPAKQTEQLVQKLQKQLSVHQRKKYRHLTIARQGRKTDNRQVFWNIEQLDEAITHKKKVVLNYLHYGYDKRQHITATYTLSPYEMVYTNEHYYLICIPDPDPHKRLYRIFMLVTMPHKYMRLYDITGRHLQFRDTLTLGLGVRYADQIMLLHRDRYYCDSIPDYSPIAHTLEIKYQSEAMRRIFYLPWDYTSEDDPCRIKLGWEHKTYCDNHPHT